MEPIVIAVAITGSVPRKADNPAVSTIPAEQVESTHAAFEAGASLVHIHVRNADESPSSDPALFAQVQEGARRLIDAGLMDERPHMQVVMGVRNALPAKERLLDLMLGEIRAVVPHATWTAAGIGVNQARVMEWVLARGGDGLRTGLEDNIRVGKDRLAGSNAELVRMAVDAAARHGRRPATPGEARAALGVR